jgi:hypothetical protein
MSKPIPIFEFEWLKALRIQEGRTFRDCAEIMQTRSAASLRAMAQRPEYLECKPRYPDQAPLPEERTAVVEGEAEVEPQSLEELAAMLDVDLDAFDVESLVINTYPVLGGKKAGYQIKARLKPLTLLRDKQVMEELREDMANHAPDWSGVEPEFTIRHEEALMVVDVFDHHFGMQAWGQETMGPDYDMKIAEDMFRRAFQQAASIAELYGVTKIVVPLGNDLVHSDGGWGMSGSGGMTSSGKITVDVDTRYRKVYRKVRQLCAEVVETMAAVAPVEVVVVPGNHGGQTEFTIGDSLECWFHGHPNVAVDNGPSVRKYLHWEEVYLGWTHGDKERKGIFPMLMATENPQMWAGSVYREMQIGHFHHGKTAVHVPYEDMNGVVVRQLPSLIPPDAYHAMKGYVMSRRGAEVHLYDPQGHCATFTLKV